MPRRPLAALLALALLTLARARVAEACSAEVTYMTLAPTQAADGATGVALDAPIVLRASVWPSTQPLENYGQLSQFSVKVKAAGSATEVAGKTSLFQGQVSWVPDSPLSASTTYEVAVHVTNTTPAPADATGPLDQTFSFSTGSALLPPLTFTTAPSYTFGSSPFETCSQSCGCSSPGIEMRPSAIITLPAVGGGASDSGYRLVGFIVDREGTIHSSAKSTGHEATLPVWLTPSSPAYEPCLRVEVSDATGRSVSTETRCFPGDWASAESPDQGGDGCNASGQGSPAGALLIGLAAVLARMVRRDLGRG